MRLTRTRLGVALGLALMGSGAVLFLLTRGAGPVDPLPGSDADDARSRQRDSAASLVTPSLSPDAITMELASLLARSEGDATASAVLNDPLVAESLRAPLLAISHKSTRPLTNLAHARGYSPQRNPRVIENMRRVHRTEGYFKERPPSYAALSPDEWVSFIDSAPYETLIELFEARNPRVATIHWDSARLTTRRANEDWPHARPDMEAVLLSRGVKPNNMAFGGGRGYYAPAAMASDAFDPRPFSTLRLLLPMTTVTGTPVVCVYEFVVDDRGGLAPFQFLFAQQMNDARGETIPYFMPPF